MTRFFKCFAKLNVTKPSLETVIRFGKSLRPLFEGLFRFGQMLILYFTFLLPKEVL